MAFVPFEKTDQPTMAAFNEKFAAAIAEAIEQAGIDAGELFATGVKIAIGTYSGSGTYGSSSPNKLTFGFEPKLVIVQGYAEAGSNANAYGEYTFISIRGKASISTMVGTASSTSSSYYRVTENFTWMGKTVSWYTNASKSASQFNASGQTYYYIAIG